MSARRAAQRLGRLGGLTRARRLSDKQRQAIAVMGGRARARSLRHARRMAENFRYVNAIRALVPPPRVIALPHCDTPLPRAHG